MSCGGIKADLNDGEKKVNWERYCSVLKGVCDKYWEGVKREKVEHRETERQVWKTVEGSSRRRAQCWKYGQSKQWVKCDLERRNNSRGIPGLPQQLMWSPCFLWWGFWNDLGETLLGLWTAWCQEWRMHHGSFTGSVSMSADRGTVSKPSSHLKQAKVAFD